MAELVSEKEGFGKKRKEREGDSRFWRADEVGYQGV